MAFPVKVHYLVNNAEKYESMPMHDEYEIACQPGVSIDRMIGEVCSTDIYIMNCIPCLDATTDNDWEQHAWKYERCHMGIQTII